MGAQQLLTLSRIVIIFHTCMAMLYQVVSLVRTIMASEFYMLVIFISNVQYVLFRMGPAAYHILVADLDWRSTGAVLEAMFVRCVFV